MIIHIIYKEAEFLKSYNENKYKRSSVTNDIIILITDDKGEDNQKKVSKKAMQVILVKREDYLYKNNLALLGGFVNMDES